MDEDELREYEEDARKHGIPYMLDRMGLDGIGNDVNDLHKHILELEARRERDRERFTIIEKVNKTLDAKVLSLSSRNAELENEVSVLRQLRLTLMAQGRHCHNCALFDSHECSEWEAWKP